MPQPISAWRMATSLDSVKIKSENRGPWREFGACYRLLFPLGASSTGYMEVCKNPALLECDCFVCCRRKLLGKEHGAGLKRWQRENLAEICCSKSVTDMGKPVLGKQAGAGEAVPVSNWEHLCGSVCTLLSRWSSALHFGGTAAPLVYKHFSLAINHFWALWSLGIQRFAVAWDTCGVLMFFSPPLKMCNFLLLVPLELSKCPWTPVMGMGPSALGAVKHGKEIQNFLKFGNKVIGSSWMQARKTGQHNWQCLNHQQPVGFCCQHPKTRKFSLILKIIF